MTSIPIEQTVLPFDLPAPPGGMQSTDRIMVSRGGSVPGDYSVPVSAFVSSGLTLRDMVFTGALTSTVAM